MPAALLTIVLGGMDMAVLTALWLLVSFWLGWSWSPWLVWALLWIGFLLWALISAGMSRLPLSLTAFRMGFTALMILVSLGLVRVIFYPGLPWSSWSWLRETLFVVPFDWRPQPRLELVVMVTHVLVALRAAAMSDRNLYDRFVLESFFRAWVGFSVCALLLEALGGPLLWSLLLGLMLMGGLAVVLARIASRVASVHTAGHSLTVRHKLVLSGWQSLGAALSWGIAPLLEGLLGSLLGVLGALLSALFALLVAALLGLFQVVLPGLVALFQGRPLPVPETTPSAPPQVTTPGPGVTPPPGSAPSLRFLPGLVQGIGGLVLLLLLFGVVSLVLQRVNRQRARTLGQEAAQREAFSLQGALGQAFRGLRETLDAVRQFGLGRALLDVVSVQAMYANVCRLAAARGVPRATSWPPDVYLPRLVALYPEVKAELELITLVYMRVHYGERSPTAEELEQVRMAYNRILAYDRMVGVAPPQPSPQAGRE